MDINQKIILKILYYIEQMDNDKEFKKNNSNISAREYLINEVSSTIGLRRINNILDNKVKRITFREIIYISEALNINLKNLFKDIE